MNKKHIVAAIDQIQLSEERRQAMLSSILNEAQQARPDAAERAAAGRASERKPASRLRWLIPTAAAFAAIAALLSAPGASMAISNWFSRLFNVHEYIGVFPEERETRPDVDAAIQSPGARQDYSIALLSETEHYARYDELRVQCGFEPYAPSDWEYLKAARAEVYDILFDGDRLIVTSFLSTDPIPFYAPEESDGLWLDWIGDGATISSDQGDIYRISCSTGIHSQPDYYYGGGRTSPNTEAMRQDGGVYLVTEFDMSGVSLPEGEHTMTLHSHIIDCNVDVQGDLATVAFIEQSFALDAPPAIGPAASQPGVQLSGTHTLTVTVRMPDAERDTFYNQEADLSGVTVTPKVTENITNVLVELSYSFPDGWAEELRRALIDGGLHKHDGLRYELLIDGRSAGVFHGSGISYEPAAITLELPLSAAQREEVKSVELRPVLGYSTGVIVGDELASDLSSPYMLQEGDGKRGYDGEHVDIPLSEVIPISFKGEQLSGFHAEAQG